MSAAPAPTTEPLYREDGYLRRCVTRVVAVDERGVQTDRSVFYALGGGQPGDTGRLLRADGTALEIVDTRRERDGGEHLHVLAEDVAPPTVGETVTLELDWERRHRIMRFHSALHLLCSVIDAPVTSGSIRVDQARLDFDLAEPVDKATIEDALNERVRRDAPMSTRRIDDAELDARPELVRTLSVQPPRDASGTVRLVEFAGIDLQPCGGTHVASSGEVGPLRVRKIEKKGRQNRRVIVVFDE